MILSKSTIGNKENDDNYNNNDIMIIKIPIMIALMIAINVNMVIIAVMKIEDCKSIGYKNADDKT